MPRFLPRLAGLLLLLLVLLPTLGRGQSFSPAADEYFTTALTLLRKNALHRRQVDWPQLEQQLRARAFSVTTPAETYPLIRLAVQALNDHHSSFVPPGGQAAALVPLSSPPRPAAPDTVSGPADVGYLRVPPFRGTDAQAQDYVARLRAQVQRQNQSGLRGWIVDMRGNPGGNMWVMLTALGPLLDEGVLGYFAPEKGPLEPWGYRQGRVFIGRTPYPLLVEPTQLRQPAPVVAVLTDGRTASSAEAVVVAFRGRARTHSFGQPTYGVPSANTTFTLPDGALLNITTAAFADRTRRVYERALAPDEPTAPAQTLSRAVEWVRAQPQP
ncbi:S41 family peptidase [Hymenobacter persicinus]|uniref:Peptidase S41 n=1 Tax=Hymenobacter persicinus TaxID=2025506 RepID=A0A4Q5L692_9BACT|nr:S41 family peptidase [Hymenobacter persicinus]RYU74529.1 peptidase S41 [Hymenobacter persicinus]